jgi:hypothetical protein
LVWCAEYHMVFFAEKKYRLIKATLLWLKAAYGKT